MTTARQSVEVWADWEMLATPSRVGFLYATPGRQKQIFSFEYDPEWLSANTPFLDPRLAPVKGPQYVADGRDNFGVFLDAAPDRWGRVLMQRREALVSREAKRAERRLMELDYLLGVYDGHRMGGLRYRIDHGPFLDDNADLASPPWTSLRELEQASLQLETEGAERNRKYAAWLRMLIAPGRSLGGARPKASVVDPEGNLWLAKFPSAADDSDVGGWESVVHALAIRAGIRAAQGKRLKLGSARHTFLSKRFDRIGTKRIHFASAMTMLDRRDGDDGASYLDLVEFLARHGGQPASDLEQLWRRLVFSVCVSNVDDHLRNHGFLLTPTGWVLAPAYDMNPNPDGNGLHLNISETDNSQDLELVRSVAKHFRLAPRSSEPILKEVVKVVSGWRAEAKKAKLTASEQDRMAPAFRIVN